MGLNVPKRGRNPYRATAASKGMLDTRWRLGPVKYEAALAEAQRKANESGLDVGLFPIDLHKEWTTRYLPARQYRTGDDTLMADGHHCQVVTPPAPECPQTAPAATTSPTDGSGPRRSG